MCLVAAAVALALATPARAHHLRRNPSPEPAAPAISPAPAVGVTAASAAASAPAAPQTQKRYYLANDDHSDYLWSGDDLTYRQVFLHMLDYYLNQADLTAGLPSDQRARFNCDGTIWLWEYEHHKTPAEYARLLSRIRDGSITVPLNTLVQLYGAMPAEAVLRSFYYAGRLERRDNLRFRLVVPMENQTLPGGVASLWAGAGALYSWKGICGCATQIDAGNRPRDIYRFHGPDGQSVLMKWNSWYGSNSSLGGYAEALDPVAAVELMSTNPDFLLRWPHDVAGAFGYGWDSLQTTTTRFTQASQDLSSASQRVIVSNELDFFADFETTAGASLVDFSGAFGNEWELLTASMGEVTSRVKRSVEKLRTAEALASLATLDDPSFMNGREAARDSAMMACGLYYEHSWTPGPGVDEATRAAWQRRIQQAVTRYVDDLYVDALAAIGARVPAAGAGVERHLVFNPLSWVRTDYADLTVVLAPPVHVVDLASGTEVPSQAVTVDGQARLRILARDIPPVGYRLYEVRPGAGASFPASAAVTLPAADNTYYRVALGGRGQITSLVDHKDADRQLVATGGALHDLGNGAGSVLLENAGPVSTTLRVVAGGAPAHETRVTLYAAGIDRVDVEGRVTQNFGGNVGYTSRFDLPGGQWRHEEVGMIARVARHSAGGDYADQNARTDYLTLNHFADLSQASRGVTVSSWDSQFFRLGNSTPTTLDAASTQFRAVVGMQVDGPGLGIGNQGGDNAFLNRYSFWTHGAFDPAAATRKSLEHQNPLAAARCTGVASAAPFTATFSLLALEGSDVLLWALKPAEDGAAQGIVARVWNLAEASRPLTVNVPGYTIAEARQVTHIETDSGPAAHTTFQLTDTLARQQMRTYRLRLTTPTTAIPPGDGRPLAPFALTVQPSLGTHHTARTIAFTIPVAGPTTVMVFDVRGAVVARVLHAERHAGPQTLHWTPDRLAAGVYFVQVEAAGRSATRRLVVAD